MFLKVLSRYDASQPFSAVFFRKRFEQICNREVEVPFMTVMKDVAIAKSEFVSGQKAINKIQDWAEDPVLFSYCKLPEVRHPRP